MGLLTRALVADPSRSTMLLMCGATAATLSVKVGYASASRATESGRKTARQKIPTDVHFQFHLKGVQKERVPPALLSVV